MGRAPCCDKQLGLKKGPWTPEEDAILVDYIRANGHGSWRSLPKLAGLERCGKSCRLRWTNYLRPDIKRGPFTAEEEKSIVQLHGIVGNKWSTIAGQLAGRTDNEIKNYWNTHLKKRLLRLGMNPVASSASAVTSPSFSAARHMAQWESARLEAEARLSRQSLIFPSSSSSAVTNSAEETSMGGQKDVFLRMWGSDVGEAFRCKQSKAVKNVEEEEECASAVTVSEVNNDNVESRSSAEADDDTYQFYLNLAAGDELSLFQNHQLGMSWCSWFGSDLNDDVSDLLGHDSFK